MKLTNNLLNNQNYVLWKAEYNEIWDFYNLNFMISSKKNIANQLWDWLMLTLIALAATIIFTFVLVSGSMFVLFFSFLWFPIILFYLYYQTKQNIEKSSFQFTIIKVTSLKYFVINTMLSHWIDKWFFQKNYIIIKKKIWN